MSVFVYDLSDPRTGCVRYVGKSVRPAERLATHIREARAGSKVHCKRWIAGLLAAGLRPVMGVIEETSRANANDAERYWIGCLRCAGADLTNLTPGGDGQAPGYRPSSEAVQACADKLRGRKMTVEQLERLRAALNRPEVRKKRSEITRARMADPEQRAVAQRGRTGVPTSDETKQKIAASWTLERKAKHAAEKSALPFDDRWREQLRAALAARWAKYRAEKNAS